MHFTRVALWALLVSRLLDVGVASAEDTPALRTPAPQRLTLFKTASEDASLVELASALDPILASALAEFANVEVAARPALDLPGMQLALDCAESTEDCLRAAAQHTDAESLLAPSVRSEQRTLVVELLHYRPEQNPAVRVVQRRYVGERPVQQALAGASDMLEELFGVPKLAAPVPPTAVIALPTSTASALDPPPSAARALEQPAVSALPFVIGGLGVALLGSSVALGLGSNASQRAFEAVRVHDRQSADRALAELDSAKQQATAANITLGLGVAALAAGALVLFLQLNNRPREARAQLDARLPRVPGASAWRPAAGAPRIDPR